jgi:hypothetical protein
MRGKRAIRNQDRSHATGIYSRLRNEVSLLMAGASECPVDLSQKLTIHPTFTRYRARLLRRATALNGRLRL